MRRVWCGGEHLGKAGQQRYQCAGCGRRQTDRSASPFRGYRFPTDVIALAVRWYLYYRLPYADVAGCRWVLLG